VMRRIQERIVRGLDKELMVKSSFKEIIMKRPSSYFSHPPTACTYFLLF